jgi:toxin ParE1/3/4
MARVIVSLLAQADSAYIIIDLTVKAGYEVAAKYAADFEALYERLATHPDSGPSRPAIGELLRA